MHYISLFSFIKLTFKGQDCYLSEGKKRSWLLLTLKDDMIITVFFLKKHFWRQVIEKKTIVASHLAIVS